MNTSHFISLKRNAKKKQKILSRFVESEYRGHSRSLLLYNRFYSGTAFSGRIYESSRDKHSAISGVLI